jgi:MFS family permease
LLYLGKTVNLTLTETSAIVASVLGGSVLSSLIAGLLADGLGRRRITIVSGAMFLVSVVLIVLSQGFTLLLIGRLLQGMSGGVIAVVIPLYLAECFGRTDESSGDSGLPAPADIWDCRRLRLRTAIRLLRGNIHSGGSR